jgi:hypothetical protein
MKKYFTLMASTSLLVLSALSGCAQKLAQKDVPAAVQQHFSKQFPGAQASWEKEKDKLEGNFKQNGKECSVLYDMKGNLLESEVAISQQELPAAAVAYIQKHYAGKKIKETARITDAKGAITFEVEVSGKDVIFDEKGNFVKIN